MALPTTFDAAYADNPWEGIVDNKRVWYDPYLINYYRRTSRYNKLVTMNFPNFADPRAETIVLSGNIAPHVNVDPIDKRTKWLNATYFDSYRTELTFNTYGGKVQYEEYDPLVTFWQQDGRNGLINIINQGLGYLVVETMENLARNAYLSFGAQANGWSNFGGSTGVDFSDITTSASDRLTTDVVTQLVLSAKYRDAPYAAANPINPQDSQLFMITTPGAIYDLRREVGEGNFIDVKRYADPSVFVNGEVGSYQGMRFIESTRAVLWNCGNVTHQAYATAAINAGDGAPDHATLVDGVYKMGQSDGVTNYITVNDASGFSVNDTVTIHVDRTSTYGVTNGVDFTDGKLHDRRIVAIDGNNISFEQPILEDFTTDLGGGKYAYVTKGQHIHTGVVVNAPGSVVMGVMQPPRIMAPPTVDDTMSVFRFSWKGRFGYKVLRPEAFTTWFGAGAFVSKTGGVTH